MMGVENEGDFEDEILSADFWGGVGHNPGGFGDEIIVNALLDFLVEEGVVGRQRLERGIPQFAGFVDVTRVEP